MKPNLKLDETINDIMNLIDMSIDPAMKAAFERAHIAINVLAIHMGSKQLNDALEAGLTKRTFDMMDHDIRPPMGITIPEAMVEQLEDLHWIPDRGNPSVTGIPMYVNPNWPQERWCHHGLHIDDSIRYGWQFSLTIYSNNTISFYDEGQCLYTLVQAGQRHINQLKQQHEG